MAPKKKIESEVNDDLEALHDPDEPEAKERKAERFFEELPTDREVRITTYKKSPISKTWEQCGKSQWLSDGNVDYDEIVDKFGAGQYQFYAHIKDENGRLKLYDSCTKRFAEMPKSEKPETIAPSITEMRRQAIDELRAFRELFPPEQKNGDQNVLILKMMEMMQTISEKQTNAQRESERRMYEALEKTANRNTSSKQELMDMFKMFTEFQETFGGQETSPFDKLLPVVGQALPSIVSAFQGGNGKASPPPSEKVIPVTPEPTEDEIIGIIYNKIPEALRKQLTPENFNVMVDRAVSMNPQISRDIMVKVGNKILKENGFKNV